MNSEQTLAVLSPLEEQIASYKEQYGELKLADPSDKEGYEIIKRAHINVKALRVEITKASKETQQPLKDVIKMVKDKESEMVESLKPLEDKLGQDRSTYEDYIAEQKRIEEERLEAIYQERVDELKALEFYEEGDYFIKRHDPTTDMEEREMSIGVDSLRQEDFEVPGFADFQTFLEAAEAFHQSVVKARVVRDTKERRESRTAELIKLEFEVVEYGAVLEIEEGEPGQIIPYDVIEGEDEKKFRDAVSGCLEARQEHQDRIAREAKEKAEREAEEHTRSIAAMRKKLIEKALDKEQAEYLRDQIGLRELGALGDVEFNELFDQASEYIGHVLSERVPIMKSKGWVFDEGKMQFEKEGQKLVGWTYLKEMSEEEFGALIDENGAVYKEVEEVLESKDEEQVSYGNVPWMPLDRQKFELKTDEDGQLHIVVDTAYNKETWTSYSEMQEYYGGIPVCLVHASPQEAQAICDAWNEKHGL